MRRLLALTAVMLSAVLVGCSPAAVTDPYVLTSNALNKPWEQVQVNVGLSFRSAEANVTVSPEMIRLVFDVASEKVLVNVAVPAEALGISAAELAATGVANGLIELDLLFDGDALFARAPVAASVVGMLMGTWDEPAEGDFTGWLRLGSVADFEALVAMMEALGGGMSSQTPDLSAFEGMTPDELKEVFEGSGVTLNYEGSETRNGVEMDHLSIILDYAEFAANPPFEGFDTEMFDQMAASGLTMTTDLWFDRVSGRVAEIHASGTSSTSQSDAFDISLTFTEPDASISFDPPGTFVDVPLFELLSGFMGGFGDPFGGDDWAEWEEDFEWDEELEWGEELEQFPDY